MISLVKPSRLLYFFKEVFEKSDINFLVYENTGDDIEIPKNLFMKDIMPNKINFAFIDDAFEGLLTQQDIVQIESIQGLDNFIVLSSNAKLKHSKCHYFNIHLFVDYYDNTSVMETQSFINTDIRSKKFLCLNRQERLHRFKVVEFLLEQNLITHGFVSCQSSLDFNNFPKKRYLDQDLRGYELSEILIKSLPLNIDMDGTVQNHPIFSHNMPKLDIHHYDSYFSIITERDFYNTEYQGFTEKVLKSILYCQPFIVVGLPNTLQLLKDCGFKTFDSFIDETYDTVEDNDLRMKLVLSEIHRLANLDYAELDKIYHSMVDIFEHNFNNYKLICEPSVLQNHIDKYIDIILGEYND